MTNSELAGLVGFSCLLAGGQALFKTSALAVTKQSTIPVDMPGLLLLPSFWLALVLYGAATLLWIYLLQTVPLSRAYPFAALGFVIVPCMAVLLFGEKLSANYLVGILFITVGILITSTAQ